MKISQLLVMGILTVTVSSERATAAISTCNKQFCQIPQIDCGPNGEHSDRLRQALTTRPKDAAGNDFKDDSGNIIAVKALNITFTGTCIGPFIVGPDAFGRSIAQQFNITGVLNTDSNSNESDATIVGNGSIQPLIVASANASVSGVTFKNTSSAPGAIFVGGIAYGLNGGAIVNYGQLSISNCVFQNNTARNIVVGVPPNQTFIAGGGGAIWNQRPSGCTGFDPASSFDCNKSGTLKVSYTRFTGNNTQGGHGAAIFNDGGPFIENNANGLQIDHCNFTGNGPNSSSVVANANIPNFAKGTTIITASSFSDSFPGLVEIYNASGDTFITNSTIAEPSSGGVGYGIFNIDGTVGLTYSTIAYKIIGILKSETSTVNLFDSIVFANHGNNCIGANYNSDPNSITDITTGFDSNGNFIFTHPCGGDFDHPHRVTPGQLQLGEFGDWGGGIGGVPLPTVPLNPNSIAIFAGDPDVCKLSNALVNVGSVDERGKQRPQDPPTNPPLSDFFQLIRAALHWCDVGAYETQTDTISFGGLFTRVYGDPPFQINTSTESNPTDEPSLRTVTYTTTTPSVCSLSGSTVTILSAGDCIIQAATPNLVARVPPPSPPCITGRSCTTTSDCVAGDICKQNICVLGASTCTDGVKNGDETGVDCGGSCPACATGQSCTDITNCVTGDACINDVCSAPVSCPATCALGQACASSASCPSGEICSDGTCLKSCSATVPCGGTNTCVNNVCLATQGCCATGQTCVADSNCVTGDICNSGVCLANDTCESFPPIPSFFGTIATKTYKILPASLTITGPTASMVYGGTVPLLFPTYTGLKYGQTAPATPPVCTTDFSNLTPAGTYPTTCTGAADSNYLITYVPGAFTVKPAPLTITASTGGTMTFGSILPIIVTPTSITGFVNGQDQSVLSNIICGFVDVNNNRQITLFSNLTPAGVYQTACTATSANYAVVPPPANCVFPSTDPACTFATVLQAALNITASSGTMIYGDAPPVITPTYTGFINDQNVPAVLPTCTTTATSLSHVSGNPYTSTCFGASDPNYTITYTQGVVTILPAPLTITASSATQPFGNVPKITPIYSGFKNGDGAFSLSTPPVCSTNTTGLSPVAGNPYISTCTGAVDPDYTFTYVPGVVTVTIGLLNVVASSPTINFGDPIPAITPIYIGLGVVPPSQVLTPTCTTTATALSEPGTYPTKCSGAAIDNFIITYTDGILTIQKDPTTTTVTTVPAPLSPQDNRVLVTVHVTSHEGIPTGEVDVVASTGETCKALLTNGTATCPLTFQTRVLETIVASYVGDGHFNPSVSDPDFLGVTQIAAPEVAAPSTGCDSTGQGGSAGNLLPMMFAFLFLLTRRALRKPAK